MFECICLKVAQSTFILLIGQISLPQIGTFQILCVQGSCFSLLAPPVKCIRQQNQVAGILRRRCFLFLYLLPAAWLPFHCSSSAAKNCMIHLLQENHIICAIIHCPCGHSAACSLVLRKHNANRKNNVIGYACELKATTAANFNHVCWISFCPGHGMNK